MGNEIALGLIATVTSLIAGVFGFGGGMLLISSMPFFLAPALIIPIHGVVQLASNGSRMLFSLTDVRWEFMPKFLLGSLIGTVIFGFILLSIPTSYLPIAIGLYILLNLWSARFGLWIRQYEDYRVIGIFQTGLGLVVGAPGPIALAVLTKDLQDKNEIVATGAMFMTISHLIKIPVFGAIGFSLFENWRLILLMSVGAVLGSYMGTRLRKISDNQQVIMLIKVALTLMAIKMVYSALIQ